MIRIRHVLASAALVGLAVCATEDASAGPSADYFQHARKVRAHLLSLAHQAEPTVPTYAVITGFGGLPPPDNSTATATPISGGRWHVEVLETDRFAKDRDLSLQRKSYDVQGERAKTIDRILADPVFFRSRREVPQTCFDAAYASVEVTVSGRSHSAIRQTCAKPDIVMRLWKAVLSPIP
jgi:hypothetical protein